MTTSSGTLGREIADRPFAQKTTLLTASDAETWDSLVAEVGGSYNQSWHWGEFRARHGWLVERVVVTTPAGTGWAQVLIRKQGLFSTAFLDRGPVISGDVPSILPALLTEIQRRCRPYRTYRLVIEPDREPAIPLSSSIRLRRYRDASPKTVMIPLLDDEPLLAQMTELGRRKIRKGLRDGAIAELRPLDEAGLSLFHQLALDTGERNGFDVHPLAYYRDFARLIGDKAALVVSMQDGQVGAACIVARFGTVVSYHFGATSTENRTFGTAALMHFEVMRWGRTHGCTKYDLLGLDYLENELSTQPWQPHRGGGNRKGLQFLKTRFGGEIVTYPPAVEIRYLPLLCWAHEQAKNVRYRLRRRA